MVENRYAKAEISTRHRWPRYFVVGMKTHFEMIGMLLGDTWCSNRESTFTEIHSSRENRMLLRCMSVELSWEC